MVHMESGILCPVLHVQVILVQLLKTDLFRRGKTRMCISSIHFFFGRPLFLLPLACGEGRRKRGRPRKKWMEEIHAMSGMNLAELRDAVEDRDVWRKLTMSIARTLRVEGAR